MKQHILYPLDIEKLFQSIANYWEESSLTNNNDKEKILNILQIYYEERNTTNIDGIVIKLIKSTLDKNKSSLSEEQNIEQTQNILDNFLNNMNNDSE